MRLLDTKYLLDFIEANPLSSIKPSFPNINKPLTQKKSEAYQELLHFLTFQEYTIRALEDLKQKLLEANSLEHATIKEWTLKHLEIFKLIFLDFGIMYLNSGNDKKGNLHLSSFDEYVDKKPFLCVINFWDCMWLLYFGDYHLDKEKRSLPDQVGSYYYTEPAPNEPSDFERLSIYLHPI